MPYAECQKKETIVKNWPTLFYNGNIDLVFPAILRFLWTKERFAREKEQIAPIALLSWATWANRSRLLFCTEWPERFAHGCSLTNEWLSEEQLEDLLFGKERGKTVKNIRKKRFFRFFSSKSLVFEPLAQVTHKKRVTWANCSQSLFCQEWPEQFALGCSFVMSNLS